MTDTHDALAAKEPEDLDTINDAIVTRRTRPSTLTHADAFQPKSVEEVMRLCDYLAKNGGDAVPKTYQGKPGAMFVAINAGAALGLSWTQSLQGVAVINGIPSVWGKTAFTMVTRHQDFEGADEFEEGDPFDDEQNYEYHVVLHRRGRQPVHRSFSKREAKAIQVSAGQGQRTALWDKPGPWADGYKRRMCRWRAFGYASADLFSDALMGFGIVEEMIDVTPAEARFTKPPASRTAAVRETIQQQSLQPGTEQRDAASFIVEPTRKPETVETHAEKPAEQPVPEAQPIAGFDSLGNVDAIEEQTPEHEPITAETVEKIRGSVDYSTARTIVNMAQSTAMSETDLKAIIHRHTGQYVLKKGASVTAIVREIRGQRAS